MELDEQIKTAESLVGLGHRLARGHHDLVVGAAQFADGPVWIAQGAPSAAHWLAERLDLAPATVREWIRIGRTLRGFDASAGAFKAGDISYAKVRVLTRYLTTHNENDLLELAKAVPADRFAEAVAAWTMANEPGEVIDARHRRDRSLKFRNHADGTRTMFVRLDPVSGGALQAAIDSEFMRHHTQREPDGTFPTLAQQRVDALCRIIAGTSASSGRVDYEIVLHVRGDGCTLDDGTPITQSSVARLLDTSFIRLLIHNAEHNPVNASTRRRHPTKRQKRIVKERDRACLDCGRTELLEYDHNPPFEATHQTRTDELELRCAPCHTTRHLSTS
ncbi:MAG: DUF222 domain-containing protein [Acidimicrobiales bacterium]